MSTRLLVLLLVASFAPQSVGAAEYEQVDEDELRQGRAGAGPARKTLAERIPAVTGRMFGKEGRFELAPAAGLSLNDPFYDHVLLSAAANFHVFEWLYVGASADFYLSPQTSLAVYPVSPEPPDYNKPVYAARFEVGIAPIYGKLSLLAEKVLHFDTYVSVGPGIVGSSEGDTALAFTASIGERVFLNEWIAVRLDVRDQVFSLARAPDKNKDAKVQNLLTISLGVCFFVPTSFEREAL